MNLIRFKERSLQFAGRIFPALRMRRRGLLTSLRAGENGQSLVETALTLPILALVILGIFQCGILFSNYIQLTNAAGQGADFLQTIRKSSTDPCADTFTAIANAAPTLTKANIYVSIILNNSNSTTAGGSTYTGTGSATCSGQNSKLIVGAPATVTVKYPASLFVYGRNFFASDAKISQAVTVYEF